MIKFIVEITEESDRFGENAMFIGPFETFKIATEWAEKEQELDGPEVHNVYEIQHLSEPGL